MNKKRNRKRKRKRKRKERKRKERKRKIKRKRKKSKRFFFLLSAPGSALEKCAAIVNPENKPTKVNWTLSWLSALEIGGKNCSLIRV